MKNKQLLNKILLSDNVVEKFYNNFNNNPEFKAWLDEVIPEVQACENQQQNNPWHKYNVLKHILVSVQTMNNQTTNLDSQTRKMLAYVMFLHDIGKPEKHIQRMKQGKLIDSFFNHNIASEKIAKRTLPQLDFTEDEIKIICKLIYKHDVFINIKEYPSQNPHYRILTPKVLQQEIEDLNSVGNGNLLMKYLIMVGRADNLAQNEQMTTEPLHLLETIDHMLNNSSQKQL